MQIELTLKSQIYVTYNFCSTEIHIQSFFMAFFKKYDILYITNLLYDIKYKKIVLHNNNEYALYQYFSALAVRAY